VPNPDPQRSRNQRASREAAPASAPARRREAWLLSGDDGLLLELGPLLGERYRTRPIDSIEALSEAGAAPWLLVFDASLRHDARAATARIEQQYPMAPIIIVCADGHTAGWASALHRGSVCAIVERSGLAGKAWQDALHTAEQRLDSAAAVATSSTLASLASTDNPFRPKRPLLLLLPLLLVAGGLAWYFFGRPAQDQGATPGSAATVPAAAPASGAGKADTAPAATATSAQPSTSAAPASVRRSPLELLSDARVAFRDEKTLLPRVDGAGAGDSALELYAQVLAQDPQNEEARDGMRRLFSVARGRIQSDLNAGRLDEATRLLATFKGVGLDASATSRLEADIAAARPRWLIAQARAALAANQLDTATQLIAQIAAGGGDRAALADLRRSLEAHASDAQLADMATRVRAAITSGALLEPAADSARTRLAAMQQLNRTHPLTLGVQHEMQLALLARVQAALRSQQPEAAQPWLTAAGELGSSPELSAARKQVQNELEAGNQRAAAAAAAASQAASLAASTTAEPSSKPDFISAKPTRPLNAVFPPRAYEKGLKGQVVVEFMLDRKGRASDTRVVEASLPGVFDEAAMQAVRTGRYDTTLLGASGQSRRARLLVTFR
jgi:TonB family protein